MGWSGRPCETTVVNDGRVALSLAVARVIISSSIRRRRSASADGDNAHSLRVGPWGVWFAAQCAPDTFSD